MLAVPRSCETYKKKITYVFIAYRKRNVTIISNNWKNKLEKKLDCIYFEKYNRRYNNSTSCNSSHDSQPDLNNNLHLDLSPLNPNGHVKEKWIVNLTDCTLPGYVCEVVQFGLNFNFAEKLNSKMVLGIL